MKRKRTLFEYILYVFFTIFLFVLLVICFYPILWMMLNSFKSNNTIFQSPMSFPEQWSFEGFENAWVRNNLGRALLNSIVITSTVVFINLFVSSIGAFATSHLSFRGRKAFLSFCIGCQVVSAQVLLVPLYKLLRNLNLYNTYPGLCLAMAAFSLPLSMYLFNSFFSGLPRDIYESTKIDGCGDFRYFLRILIPLSKPIISSVTILQAVFAWNEYIFTLTFLRDMDAWTIQPVIKNLFQGYSVNYGVNFAALSIVVIPILVLYVFMQKYFIRGLTAGSTKG